MRGKIRALRAAFSLTGTLFFFLEGECTLAQATPEPVAPAAQPASGSLPLEEDLQTPSPPAPAPPDSLGSEQKIPRRVVVTYGQASAPTSQGFAEAMTLSVARDFRLFGPLRWSLEATPVMVVRETRVDDSSRPRATAFAFAVLPLVVFDAFPRSAVGVRLEGGAGFLWATAPVPAEGSHANFFDVFGVRAVLRAWPEASVSLGVRRTHVSNLGLAGPDNPGLSFYAGAVALDFAR